MEGKKTVANPEQSSIEPSPASLNIYRTLVLLFLFLLLAGALALPFYYETKTLWYKIGIDKTFLRVGQMVGMLTLVLLFLQITLSTRSKFLEMLFGPAALLGYHRANGVLIAFLAASHVLLMLVPEGLTNLPIGKKYWPEMVGSLLFTVILGVVISSHFRQKLNLDYRKWKALHKPLGYLVIVLVMIHVLYVSESFEHIIPKGLLLSLFTCLVLQIAIVKGLSGRTKK